MNKVCFYIENCCDCPYSYIEDILGADSFDHDKAVYCSKVEDRNSYNKEHRMIAADDWDVRKYCQIPDWCPIKYE